ncbi:MAG: AraC family transcriptional regulator [Clostridia bacterium]|nr:AraC family transcriptional regulator [Clostridia bacterium]
MNYACELLITRRYSVTSISEMIGYKNVYYFSKVFKKTFGITPTEYQNMN